MTRRPSNSDSHGPSFPTEESTVAFYITEFNSQYPTDEDCLEELYKRADSEAVHKCRHCGNSLLNKRYGDRVTSCHNCSKQTWHTAGTFFEGIRVAKAWLAAIWLMERGVALTSSSLHRLIGIAQSTALKILHKIRSVIRNYIHHDASAVPSSIFLNVFRKRSFVTPASSHPRAEQEEIDKLELGNSLDFCSTTNPGVPASLAADIAAKFFGRYDAQGKRTPSATDAGDNKCEEVAAEAESEIGPGGISGREKELYELLSEKPMSADQLCDLTGMPVDELSVSLFILELSKLVERGPGDCYAQCRKEPSPDVASLLSTCDADQDRRLVTVSLIIAFIVEHYHGISRKYLQNYLAAFWCYSNRASWPQGSLLQLCRKSSKITDSEILGYVSPPIVMLMS